VSKPFADRADAGRVLAGDLAEYAARPDVIVLGLPRGGIPVAYEVACALGAPLDVFVVRKLGAPGQEELAMGAIASGNVVVLNDEVIEALQISAEELKAEIDNESRELERREAIYRGGRPLIPVKGKTVILIDDGLATGSTMRAAVAALRRQAPARIVVAVPVGASSTCAEFERIADQCVCAIAPEEFRSVGLWYEDFTQTDDEEVCNLLTRAASREQGVENRQVVSRGVRLRQPAPSEAETGSPPPRPQTTEETEVAIAAGQRTLHGTLSLPEGAPAVVVFAHGSGSGRLSPRNQYVAQVLQSAGLGTLLIDLLEEDEAGDRSNVFDISLLAARLQAAAAWLAGHSETADLHVGYFGASTGAAAALAAAAEGPTPIGAIVSRGGRPDLALDALPRVTAPCLLIVGGNDRQVLELNRQAFERLTCLRQLVVVKGATHLFPEPGALEEVSRLAKEWFLQYLK
jgi:predicted phosphoribosyltransferase/dienelactone hydrolase